MKEINIAIFGAPINNVNLGCQALTYSLINLLEEISKKNSYIFKYYIFEWEPDEKKKQDFCKKINLSYQNIILKKTGNYNGILRKIKHLKDNRNMEDILSLCDFAIDLTEGDSFSDIYGNTRFNTLMGIKEKVESLCPLILGSQTYGPFNKEKNIKKSANILQKATVVFARDNISKEYVKSISNVDSIITCDLAFRLPYNHIDSKIKRNLKYTKKIGFNVSGLLISNAFETTKKSFTLKTNYDIFVENVLKYLLQSNYEIHLIGHVGADYLINKQLKAKYQQLILAPEFNDPMNAKSYISNMDLFIGSRMHATIGALTSNTPVIPVAYSRKFKGLFDSVNLKTVVDMQELTTEQSVEEVIKLIENFNYTKEQSKESYRMAINKNIDCYEKYESAICKILNREI